jgi:hypothetical protein
MAKLTVGIARKGPGYVATWEVTHSIDLNRDGMDADVTKMELVALVQSTAQHGNAVEFDEIEIIGYHAPLCPIVSITGNDGYDWCEWDVDGEKVCHVPISAESLGKAINDSFAGNWNDARVRSVAMDAATPAFECWQKLARVSKSAPYNGSTWTRGGNVNG